MAPRAQRQALDEPLRTVLPGMSTSDSKRITDLRRQFGPRPPVGVVCARTAPDEPLLRVLRTCGALFQVESQLDALIDLPPEKLVIIDVEALSDAARDRLASSAPGPQHLERLFICGAEDGRAVRRLIRKQIVTNLLCRSSPRFYVDLHATVARLLSGEARGLTRYFGWAVVPVTLHSGSAVDDQQVADEAQGWAAQLTEDGPTATSFRRIAEDLLAAARAHWSAVAPQQAHAGALTVTLCSDGRTLGIAVGIDHAAATRAAVLQAIDLSASGHLQDLSDETPAPRRAIVFPSGLGTAHQLIVDVQLDRRTELMALIQVDAPAPESLHPPAPQVNLFTSPRRR